MSDEKYPTAEPKMSIGDTFYSRGREWRVVREPFLNDSTEGNQWWYPSQTVDVHYIMESLVDGPSKEKT